MRQFIVVALIVCLPFKSHAIDCRKPLKSLLQRVVDSLRPRLEALAYPDRKELMKQMPKLKPFLKRNLFTEVYGSDQWGPNFKPTRFSLSFSITAPNNKRGVCVVNLKPEAGGTVEMGFTLLLQSDEAPQIQNLPFISLGNGMYGYSRHNVVVAEDGIANVLNATDRYVRDQGGTITRVGDGADLTWTPEWTQLLSEGGFRPRR